MKTWPLSTICCMLAVAAFGHVAGGQVVLRTDNLELTISDGGMLESLAAKPAGTEYSAVYERADIYGDRAAGPIAVAYRGNRAFPASQVLRSADRLTVHFSGTDVAATYQVRQTEHYLAFQLVSLAGEPVDRIDLVQLRVRKLDRVGRLINVNYDDEFGICLCAGNVQTNASMDDRGDYLVMRATAEKEVALVGTTAVLFGCPDPRRRFLDVMEIVERDYALPAGAKHRRLPVGNYSYLWARPTPENVDQYVELAKRGGFRVILFSYTSFTDFPRGGPGHFAWGRGYPNGVADLKKVTDTIRRAGLKLGLHIHYNKAVKSDPYVSPVPDDRLHKVRTFTVAAGVDGTAETLPVKENPGGSALDDGMRVLQIGKELVAYEGYTTTPPYRFTGCDRGHLSTAAAAHQEGDSAGLLDVDTWHSFIRYDQNTDIQDETARRIAEIYHQTGPYDLIYFDGAEDVHEPTWYHVANAQYRVYRLLDPEPPACEAAFSSHFSWHMIPRGNAWDVIAETRGMKDFCDVLPCRSAPAAAHDFTRIEFGWIGRFGTSRQSYVEPDGLEYVLSRCAAWDCPFSLSLASPAEVTNNPRWEDCFEAIKIWEEARIGRALSEAQLAELRNVEPGREQFLPCLVARRVWDQFKTRPTPTQRAIVEGRQEWHLLINEQGRHEPVAIEEIPDAAGGSLRTFAFRRAGRPNETYLLVWAVGDAVPLRLPVPPDRLRAMRPFGRPHPVEADGPGSMVRIAGRTYLVLPGMEPNEARTLLQLQQ